MTHLTNAPSSTTDSSTTDPRATDRYVQAGAVRTRYRTSGASGLPVVMLHGIGRTLEDWSLSLPALGAQHRAFALDTVGFGLSDKPDGPYTMPALAQHVREVMDALGLERAALVGSSLGGAVALEFAVTHPSRVAALALVGSAGFGREVTLGLRLSTVPWLGEWLTKPSLAGAERVLHEVFRDQSLVTPERVQRDFSLALEPGAQAAFLKVSRALGTFGGVRADWREAITARLSGLNVPTLVAWGQQDKILPVAHLERARRLLPRARTHVFDPCGHFPQLEVPEAFNALLLEFLAFAGVNPAPSGTSRHA
jgi:pimeloyl-ACP methyl ester carboxylesterase